MVTSHELLPLMTVEDVSEVSQIPCSTVRCWSDLGILKPYRMSNRGDQIFDTEDINTFLLNSGYQMDTGKRFPIR